MSVQVDRMSSVFIPAEAVQNNQDHLVANKVGRITSTLCAYETIVMLLF